MATMPSIDFGSRKLEIPGNVATPHLAVTDNGSSEFYRNRGRAIERATGALARGLYEIAEIKDRADERDARYAMQQAENWFNSKWNGTDAVGADGKTIHTPGVADRDFRQMEMDGTDSMTECRKLKTEFRDTDIYKNLGAGARKHFDRQFAIYEGKLDLAAAENHRKLAAQKIKVQTEADAVHTANGVQMNFGADDVTFENSASWGATQMTRIKLGSLVENGEEIAANDCLRLKDMVFRGGKRFEQLAPDEQKYVKDVYEKSLNSFRKNRIKALADAASTGNGLGTLRPEQCLDKAMEMTFVLNGAGYGFRPDGTKKGTGWLGTMMNGNGQAVSELSFQSDAVKIDGKRIDIPMLVPGLTKEEIGAVKALSEGGKPDEKIIASAQQKAVNHAKKQIDGGKSVWKDSGTGVVQISDAERNEILGYINKAARGFDAKLKIKQSENFKAADDDFRKNILAGTEDTNVLLSKNFDKVEYAKKIAGLVATRQIDEASALVLQKNYNQLADRKDYIQDRLTKYKATGKGGVWTRVKDRNGNEIDVFQPDRPGNGKTETDPTIAAKYTMKDRNGNTPYFNNPAVGMEDLDFDLRMGNISVPFYNAQMAALRVYSDTKAKTAFVKIFGAHPSIFNDKDIEEFKRKGLDTSYGTNDDMKVWAKNKWWAGNHNVGNKAATWQEDALKGDGGEYKVSLEQEAQICEMVLQLTAEGVDPTDAIQAYLAPTFDGWMKTDLSERLDPSKKIGGKTFRDWILESKRFGSAVGPRGREARLQARQKQAYEAK